MNATPASAPISPSTSPARRAVALTYGVVCHLAFLVGVGAMVLGLYSGMQTGLGPLSGAWAVTADALLVLQFPLVHSFFLSRPGGRQLARLAPLGLGRELATTSYATFASLQVLTVFALWSPVGEVWWSATGAAWWVSITLYALSWALVVKTMHDAGLGTQMGYTGWLAVARGRPPRYGGFPTAGTFRHCRQPVYAAFALTLWTGPTWTPDHLALAFVWTGYCVLGPRLKEARYRRRYGDAFVAYQRAVPYWLPALRPRWTREGSAS